MMRIIFFVVVTILCCSMYARSEEGERIQVHALLIKAPDSILKELGIWTTLKKLPDREKLIAICAERRDIGLFAYPAIIVFNGVKGSVSNATHPVQYMQKLPDENFMLITHEDSVGIVFEVTATINNENYIDAEVNFQVIKLESRLPIEGVYLDIGQPIFEKASFKNKVRLKNGEVMRLGGGKDEFTGTTPLRSTHSRLIILMSATIVTEKYIYPHTPKPPKKKYMIREVKPE